MSPGVTNKTLTCAVLQNIIEPLTKWEKKKFLLRPLSASFELSAYFYDCWVGSQRSLSPPHWLWVRLASLCSRCLGVHFWQLTKVSLDACHTGTTEHYFSQAYVHLGPLAPPRFWVFTENLMNSILGRILPTTELGHCQPLRGGFGPVSQHLGHGGPHWA